ncbi:hypothetical protein ACHAWO_009153 [Cyclotella atomus]|uniref:Uncharacterized protein n=1 Tax=Cyclotella atomus TaxID=382360 RepID=A0ABD3PNP2_9STRA
MDGWEEDDVFTDEAFDDIDNAAVESSPAKPAPPSALTSFTQHHEMSLDLTSPRPPYHRGDGPLGIHSSLQHIPTENQNNGWDAQDDIDIDEDSLPKEGVLSRAAGAFGAALLASVDDGNSQNDDEEEDGSDDESEVHEKSFSFGGGFVMKGLRGFIDAATAPPPADKDGWEDDDGLDLEEDGWSDDDGLDDDEDDTSVDTGTHGLTAVEELKQTAGDETQPIASSECASPENSRVEEPELQEEPIDESGWDDFDLDVSGDKPDESQSNIHDTADASVSEVSDSLKDFVAKTESTLISAFNDVTKTPRKTPRDEFVAAPEEHANDDNVASKELTDFVDNLDAELNELQSSMEADESAAPVIDENETYNFDENKNNSPEPIEAGAKKPASMPHQDSWYLNAMEGGAGGIVHSEKITPIVQPQKSILPMDSGLSLNDTAPSETPVGMPISEVPSVVNSQNSSKENLLVSSNNLDNMSSSISSEQACSYEKPELQCKCLELILPLPEENGNGSSVEESGFGTKTLPDGTTVLVNYEKLLQNEAVKRILLQRSVETYERTMEKMQARHCSMIKASQEHEEVNRLMQSQLDEAQHENSNLKELVARLEKEKELMKAEVPSSEAHLFQEELLAVASEKERLEKLAKDLQEQVKQANEKQASALESCENLTQRLEKAQNEQSRLEELVQMVQSDLSEAQQTCSLLQSENDALQQELDAKAVENVESGSSDEIAALHEKIAELNNELEIKSSDCDSLNDQIGEMLSEQASRSIAVENLKQENDSLASEVAEMREMLDAAENEKESLRTMHDDSQARIAELTAMVESMDSSTAEVDRFAAENASLTYELGVKSAENKERLVSLKSLQQELDSANSKLLAMEQTINNGSDPEMLKAKLANLQNEYDALEQSKLDLESALDAKSTSLSDLQAQVDTLHAQASHTEQLQGLIDELKEIISSKDSELEAVALANEELKSQILSRGNDEQLAESREELSSLQSQFDEFREHHNNTMGYMEEQLSGLMQQKSACDVQLEECKNEIDRIQRENTELSTALNVAQSQGDMVSNNEKLRVQELKNERTQLCTMLDQQRNDLNNQRQTFDELSQEHEGMKSNFERVQMDYGNVLARNRALEQDNKSLEFQLNEISAKSNHLAATHRATEQDKNALEFQLKESVSRHAKLEADIASLRTQMEEQEKEAFEAIAQWEARCLSLETSKDAPMDAKSEVIQLQHDVATLTGQLGDVTNQLEFAQTTAAAEREKLLLRIAELEQEDETVNELRDELTSLHEERQQLDLDNEELLVQLGLMQQSKIEHDEELQDELTRLRGQVATLQDNVSNLQVELDQARYNNASSNTNDGLNSVVERLHRENDDLQNNISRLSSEKGSLEDDINALSETVKTLEQQVNGKDACDAEIQRLKAQIDELETKLSEQENHTKEVQALRIQIRDLETKLSRTELEATAAADEMKHALEQKDGDILKLKTEGYLRENTLKDMERHVEAKNIVESMPTTIFNDEEEKDYGDDDSLQDLLADDIESDDYLRHQIVILAQALERSELQRADVLDRLTRERKFNADSLKQLGESVKRFYSTVRSSGATS